MADFIRDHGKHEAEVPGIEEEQVLEDEMTYLLDSKHQRNAQRPMNRMKKVSKQAF